VPDPSTCRSRPAPRRAGAVACPADGPPAPRPVGLRTVRVLTAIALGATLLLACCSGGAATAGLQAGPPPAASAAVITTAPLAAAAPVRVRIPAIDVDSALVGLGLQADGTLQVPADGSVAGWFTGAPTPGERGPAVLAAHVDWDHAPGVFFDLRDLEPGDEVIVDRADGSTARFVVLGVEQYPKNVFPTERVYGDIDHAGLRLITCGGEFDREARSYRDNVVVYAGLVGSSAGAPPA
jgi:sortase (surface protein transpeptidase)